MQPVGNTLDSTSHEPAVGFADAPCVVFDVGTGRLLSANRAYADAFGSMTAPPFDKALLARTGTHRHVPLDTPDHARPADATVLVIHTTTPEGGLHATCIVTVSTSGTSGVHAIPVQPQTSVEPVQRHQGPRRERVRAMQRERLSANAALAATVTQDLRAALAVLVGNHEELATFVAASTEHADLAGLLEDDEAAIASLDRVISALSLVAAEAPENHPVELRDVVDAAVDLVSYDLASRRIELSVELAGDPIVNGDFGDCVQVVTQMIRAVVEAAAPGTTLSLRVAREGDDILTTVSLADEAANVHALATPRGIDAVGVERCVLATLAVVREMARRHGGDLCWPNESQETSTRYALRLRAA